MSSNNQVTYVPVYVDLREATLDTRKEYRNVTVFFNNQDITRQCVRANVTTGQVEVLVCTREGKPILEAPDKVLTVTLTGLVTIRAEAYAPHEIRNRP